MYSLSPVADTIKVNNDCVFGPDGVRVYPGVFKDLVIDNFELQAESVLIDDKSGNWVIMGCKRFCFRDSEIVFNIPTDLEMDISTPPFRGILFSSNREAVKEYKAVNIETWKEIHDDTCSNNEWTLAFRLLT